MGDHYWKFCALIRKNGEGLGAPQQIGNKMEDERGVTVGEKCYAAVLLEELPSHWFEGISESTKVRFNIT